MERIAGGRLVKKSSQCGLMMTFSAFSFFNCSFLFQLRNGESVACLVLLLLSSPDDLHEPLFDRLVQLFVFFCGLYDCVYSVCFFPPFLLFSNFETVLLRWCGGT